MSFSEAEDEREDSSSPPARRAILPTRDHFWRASDVVRLRPGLELGSVPVPFSMGRVRGAGAWGGEGEVLGLFHCLWTGVLALGDKIETHRDTRFAYFGPSRRRI